MQERPIRSGLVAGAVAAIVASAVQLPLHAPLDSYFNSATVMIGGLAAGGLAGLVWRLARRISGRRRAFYTVWVVGFGIVVLLAMAGEIRLERSISFLVPIAAIVFATTGVLTPWLAPSHMLRRWWPAMLLTGAAIVMGIGLMGFGDQKSGKLELPPRAQVSARQRLVSKLSAVLEEHTAIQRHTMWEGVVEVSESRRAAWCIMAEYAGRDDA